MTTNYCYKKLKEKVEKMEKALKKNTEDDQTLAGRVTNDEQSIEANYQMNVAQQQTLDGLTPATDAQIDAITTEE